MNQVIVRGRWAEELVDSIMKSADFSQKEDMWRYAAERAKSLRLENAGGSKGWTRGKTMLHESSLPSSLALHPQVTRLLNQPGITAKDRAKIHEELLNAVNQFRAR